MTDEEVIEALRRNFAKFLAPLYIEDQAKIAKLCDEELDQSGVLLGYVRDVVREWRDPWRVGDTCYISGIGSRMSKGKILMELQIPGYETSPKHWLVSVPIENGVGDDLLEVRCELLGMWRYDSG